MLYQSLFSKPLIFSDSKTVRDRDLKKCATVDSLNVFKFVWQDSVPWTIKTLSEVVTNVQLCQDWAMTEWNTLACKNRDIGFGKTRRCIDSVEYQDAKGKLRPCTNSGPVLGWGGHCSAERATLCPLYLPLEPHRLLYIRISGGYIDVEKAVFEPMGVTKCVKLRSKALNESIPNHVDIFT